MGGERAGSRKGEQTRQGITRKVAPIFNQRGYDGAALYNLLRVTGLEKGGIYRHFESKQRRESKVGAGGVGRRQVAFASPHRANSQYLTNAQASGPAKQKATASASSM